MKILLTTLNSRYSHSSLALKYLRESIKDLNHRVIIKEFSINQNQLEILQEIHSLSPDIIGFSTYIWNSSEIKELLPSLKLILPSCKIILGGPEVSYNSQKWIENFQEIDYLLTGMGESSFRELASTNFSIKDQNSEESESKIIKPAPMSFLEIPLPYNDEDFENLTNKYIYYESSRGCPFKCSYCLSSRSDQRLELKPAELVKKEIQSILKHNVKIIKFIDRTFNIDKERTADIWQYLIDIETDSLFHFEVHPELLDERDFAILEKCPSGRFQFEIGIQSTNEETLKEINRTMRWSKVRGNIKRLMDLKKIHIHLDLIAGLPLEDINSFRESFNNVYSLYADHLQLGFLKILPGTEMEEKRESYEIEFHQKAPYEVLQTKWMDFATLSFLHKVEDLIDNIYNSKNFKSTLNFLETLFKDPFEMYEKLALFISEKDNLTKLKEWKKIGAMLIEFIRSIDLHMKVRLLDYLRWDWCNSFPARGFPDFLNNSFMKEIKSEGHQKLKELILSENNDVDLPINSLGKVIYYGCEDKSSQSKILGNEQMVALYSQDNKLLKIYL